MRALFQRLFHRGRPVTTTEVTVAAPEAVPVCDEDPPTLSLLFDTLWRDGLEPG